MENSTNEIFGENWEKNEHFLKVLSYHGFLSFCKRMAEWIFS